MANQEANLGHVDHALTTSRSKLLEFLEDYQVPSEYTVSHRNITIPFLQMWGHFIVGWQIRENPATQAPVQDWTSELVIAFLFSIFDNRKDNDGWEVDHGPPEMVELPKHGAPKTACGKIVRRPSSDFMDLLEGDDSSEECAEPAEGTKKRKKATTATKAKKPERDCCKPGQPANLVLELQNCLTFFPVFKIECEKSHYMSKLNSTTQSQDNHAMFGTAASLLRQWDLQERKTVPPWNTALIKCSFRRAVYFSHVDKAAQDTGNAAKLGNRPYTFYEMVELMREPKLIMVDFVNAVDRLTDVYNEQVAEGNEIGQLFANMQIGRDQAQKIEGLQAAVKARDATIAEQDATIVAQAATVLERNTTIVERDATVLQQEQLAKNKPEDPRSNPTLAENDVVQQLRASQQQVLQLQEQLQKQSSNHTARVDNLVRQVQSHRDQMSPLRELAGLPAAAWSPI